MLVRDPITNVFVLIENDIAYTADRFGEEPLEMQRLIDSDSDESTRLALMEIKEYFGFRAFPQTITLDLRQAQAIFNVKAGRVSPEWGFNTLIHLLNV